jgi:glycosyltransferase involved in cell wall biosynthesis
VALLEAMACAVPAVATAVGGSAEVLRDGATGFLVPPERPDALAGAIAAALLDPAARGWAGAAREEVVSRYGLHQVADTLLDVYARLRRPGPASQGGAQRRWPSPT